MHRLQDLDTVNFMIRENHQQALRDEQARIVQGDQTTHTFRHLAPPHPVTTFFERLSRTRMHFPRKMFHVG